MSIERDPTYLDNLQIASSRLESITAQRDVLLDTFQTTIENALTDVEGRFKAIRMEELRPRIEQSRDRIQTKLDFITQEITEYENNELREYASSHNEAVAKRKKQLYFFERKDIIEQYSDVYNLIQADHQNLLQREDEDIRLQSGLELLREDATVQMNVIEEQEPPIEAEAEKALVSLPIQDEIQLREQVAHVLMTITETVPESMIEQMTEILEGRVDLTRDQFTSLAKMVVDFQTGVRVRPQADEFLSTPKRYVDNNDKLKLSVDTLQSMVAESIIQEGTVLEKTPALKYRLGVITNNLKHYLNDSNNTEIFIDALDQLSAVERTLLICSLSTDIKRQLGYPDLEECSEGQMAEYLRNVPYMRFNKGTKKSSREDVSSAQIDTLEMIMDACSSRDKVNIHVRTIIDRLLEREHHPDMFLRMIAIASDGGILDYMIWFFRQHTQTSYYADICQNAMDEGIDFDINQY